MVIYETRRFCYILKGQKKCRLITFWSVYLIGSGFLINRCKNNGVCPVLFPFKTIKDTNEWSALTMGSGTVGPRDNPPTTPNPIVLENAFF